MEFTRETTRGFIFVGDSFEIHATHSIFENRVDFHWCFKNYSVLNFMVGMELKDGDTFEDTVDTLFKNGYLFDIILGNCMNILENELDRDDCLYWDEYGLAVEVLKEFNVTIPELENEF